MKGLEPPRLSAPDPKSGAATNYATSAASLGGAKLQFFLNKIYFNKKIFNFNLLSNQLNVKCVIFVVF